MERIYFNNDYIIIADNKLGNDFRCESILKSLNELNNEDGIIKDKTIKDKINQNIPQIMNLGINEMFNKLFDCEYG